MKVKTGSRGNPRCVDGIGDVLKWKSLSQIKQDTDGENEEDLSNISLEFR